MYAASHAPSWSSKCLGFDTCLSINSSDEKYQNFREVLCTVYVYIAAHLTTQDQSYNLQNFDGVHASI